LRSRPLRSACARHLHEDDVEAGDLFADALRLVEAADAFHDHAGRVDLQDDPLLRQLLGRFVEGELAVFPAEQRVDDFQDVILDAPPEVFRRDGAHLHEQLCRGAVAA
jgi:hypothetical protein